MDDRRIKISRTLFARLPGGTSSNLAEFVGHLNRRVAYLDGVLAALHIVRSQPRRMRNAIFDALEADAVAMRGDAMESIERMSKEIVGL